MEHDGRREGYWHGPRLPSQHGDRRDQDEPELRMLIHQSQAGCVIGTAHGYLPSHGASMRVL